MQSATGAVSLPTASLRSSRRNKKVAVIVLTLAVVFLATSFSLSHRATMTVPPPVKLSNSVGSTQLHATSSALVNRSLFRNPPPQLRSGSKVNGVILFLSGGRWDSYFVRECLPRLQLYYLACYPKQYPLHVFHEALSATQQALIGSKVPSARSVDFEDVSRFWKHLPRGVSEDALQQWMATGLQRKFQGRGYRIMCRFWHGLVWRLPSMQKYDYYWRLDTDSILTQPPLLDPFVRMQRDECDYGFNRLKGENPHVAVQLWETFMAWTESLRGTDATSNRTSVWLPRVKSFALERGVYWAPMYYNNFELGSMRLKLHPLYLSWFDFVDSREPFGTFRHRWGDAPLHTLGVEVVLAAEGWRKCNFTKADVGYRHAAEKPGPIVPMSCTL